MKCPNKSHPDWIALEKLVGKNAAYAIWIKNGEEIPRPKEFDKFKYFKPIELPKYSLKSTEGKRVAENTLKEIASRLADRIGYNVQFEDNPVANWKGKLEGKTATINLAHATLDTPIHELLGHPVISYIRNGGTEYQIEKTEDNFGLNDNKPFYTVYSVRQGEFDLIDRFDSYEEATDYINKARESNPNLFNNLIKELETGKGKEVFDRIKRDYSELRLELQQEEAIVELLGLLTAEKLDEVQDRGLIALLKQLLQEIQGYIKSLIKAKEIEVANLPNNLTLNDLANIFAYSNSKLILPGHKVLYTTPDNVSFESYTEASRHLSHIANRGQVDLSKVGLEKELSSETLQRINNLESDIFTLKEKIKSDTYKEEKKAKIEKLREEVKELQSTQPVFQFQEPYIAIDGWDYARVQHTESPIRKGEHKDKLGDYKGYYIFGYNAGVGTDSLIIPISDEEARTHWEAQGSDRDYHSERLINNLQEQINQLITDAAIHGEIFNISREIVRLRTYSIEGFIERNKPYEESLAIIEEWKKVNEIKYNPEEVYSRGQGFYSVVGAYSDLDVALLFQNLLTHIEDNEKAGGEFIISAFTRPVDKKLRHLDGINGKIRFKIVPSSDDIKWAANADVYSGSVWDAAEIIDPSKPSEILGVSYTKAPALENIYAVQPNLASIIDNISHAHNELGISLTGNNFRLEYDSNIPYSTKKLINNINAILDQRYGKLVEPTYSSGKTITKYAVVGKFGQEPGLYNTREAAQERANTLSQLDYMDIYTVKPITMVQGVEPTKTSANIDFEKISYNLYGYNILDKEKYYEFTSDPESPPYEENLIETPTKQAKINLKIAKLKEASRKYPRSLIRSTIVRSDYTHTPYNNDTLPFQKVPSQVNTDVGITSPENIADDLFIPGFTPHLQQETVNHIFEYVIAFIRDNPGVSFNEAILDYLDYAKGEVVDGDQKFQPIIDQIDRFRPLVKDRIDRLGLLSSRPLKEDESIDADESGDQVADGFYWQDDWVYKFDAKANALQRIKEFLIFIPKTSFKNGVYSEVYNYLNTVSYMSYDDVFEDLKALLADEAPTWTVMRKVLEDHQEAKPWIHSLLYLIDNYEGDQQQLINQFVSAISSTHSNFKTLLWDEKAGAYTAKLIDTDQNSAQKTILAKWQDNFNQSKILTTDNEGNVVAIKEELDATIAALDELKESKKNIKEFLASIGIEASNQTIKDLLDGQVGGLSYEHHFKSKRGLFYNIRERLLGKDAKGLEFGEVVNPVINNSGARALAKAEVKYNSAIYSNSLLNGEGNTVYSYSFNKFVTKRYRELKDINFVNRLSEITFQKPIVEDGQPLYQSWIWMIQNNPLFLEHFDIGSFDTMRKDTTFDDGIKLTNMTDIDIELAKLTAFQNQGETNYVKGLGRLSHYLFTVPSKTTAYTFTAPAIDVNVSKEGKLGMSTKKALYTVALSELSRINTARDRKILNKKYKAGNKFFYFFPQLNKDSGLWTEEFTIWNPDGSVKLPTTKVGDKTVESIILDVIESVIKEDVNNKIEYWKSIGFIQGEKLIYMDESYRKLFSEDDKTNTQLAAYDYIINNMLAKFNLHQVFIGDPATYFKENVAETWDDLGKRLAAMIAPGKDLALESETEEFISIKAKDRKGALAFNIKELDELLGDAAKPYHNMEATDAAEFVTLREKLTVLYKLGQITTETRDSILDRYEKEGDNLVLSKEELSQVYQPDKPVYVNSEINPEEDVIGLDYVKSSSIPLIPQITQGVELDKLRKAMEKVEKKRGLPVRLAFDSATKLGGIPSIDIFEANGNIKDNLDLNGYTKTYRRSGFRIQQDVPFDPTYEEVIKASQPTKLLFDNAIKQNGFQFKHHNLSGEQLIDHWNKLHNSLFEWTKDKLHKDILDPTGKLDIAKAQAMLVQEARLRSHSPAELASLSLLPDNTFEFPFWAVTSSKKYESILTSLYTNNVIKQKMHGHSYVLVPEEGMQGRSKGIVYTRSYDPTTGLKPMRIEKETSQVVERSTEELLSLKVHTDLNLKVVKVSSIDPTTGKRSLDNEVAGPAITELKKQYKRLESLAKCLTK